MVKDEVDKGRWQTRQHGSNIIDLPSAIDTSRTKPPTNAKLHHTGNSRGPCTFTFRTYLCFDEETWALWK